MADVRACNFFSSSSSRSFLLSLSRRSYLSIRVSSHVSPASFCVSPKLVFPYYLTDTQRVVDQAFQFCVSNERKTEFRRLCEIIRKDLATVNKYAHQTNTINLSDPDVLARHLETRFNQLNSAVDLELWQEAFRSVEDIQGLLANPASKKAQKPAMMANYYEKLTRVFKAEGGSMAVFHAAAWGRYMMYIEKGKDGEEMEKLAGFVLLSALAVPVMEDGEGKKNAGKLVTLLNLPKMPTRAGLLKEAVRVALFFWWILLSVFLTTRSIR